MYIAPALRDEVTLSGRVCLSPQSKRRLFLHLPGVWCRTFAMRSPLRVESFSGLNRNKDSSRTCPSVLVPGLRDEVTLIGSRCVFLRTRSERRLVPSTYPRLLRDGVTLRVECGLSSHSIETKFSLDSWSVFLQDGVTLCGSGSRNLLLSEGMPRIGLMGAFLPGRPRDESRHPLVDQYALWSRCVLYSSVFASCVDSVCTLLANTGVGL